MSSLPGHAGMPVVGDKSLEFYKDAMAFVEKKMEQYNSRMFVTRMLNKPTVIIGSNAATREMVLDKDDCLEQGYKSLLYEIYGDNVLFTNGDEATCLRDCFQILLSPDFISRFYEVINMIVAKTICTIDTSKPTCVYTLFKKLSTEICLSMFLDLDFDSSSEFAQDIVATTTTHWHGIISVPVSVKIPGSKSSGYAKALAAKDKLLGIIKKKVAESKQHTFARRMSQLPFPQENHIYNHMLLLTSAVVPKAFASLLTSFTMALAVYGTDEMLEEAMSSEESLERIWLEVQRLWPPFVGGRKLVRKDCTIDGHHIPKGHSLLYISRAAQRDPAVFRDPDDFIPDRWKEENAGDKDKLFLFGGGKRSCMGLHVVWYILKSVSRALLGNYTWALTDNQDLTLKWLPVSRPQKGLSVKFDSKRAKRKH